MTTMQKQTASKFVDRWTFQRGSEKGEDLQVSTIARIIRMICGRSITNCY